MILKDSPIPTFYLDIYQTQSDRGPPPPLPRHPRSALGLYCKSNLTYLVNRSRSSVPCRVLLKMRPLVNSMFFRCFACRGNVQVSCLGVTLLSRECVYLPTTMFSYLNHKLCFLRSTRCLCIHL